MINKYQDHLNLAHKHIDRRKSIRIQLRIHHNTNILLAQSTLKVNVLLTVTVFVTIGNLQGYLAL
jgi:hypothetical protein